MATYLIKDDRLEIDGKPVRFEPSPNHGGRIRPNKIIVHDTAHHNMDGTISWFKNRKSKVSAHFVVGLDGTIVQMVDCDRRAQHAGKSVWKGKPDANGYAIGIEIVNCGKLTKNGSSGITWYGHKVPIEECKWDAPPTHGPGWWQPYPSAQIDAVCKLIRACKAAYPSIDNVLGHYHVSPRRKVDVNPLFPIDLARNALKSEQKPPSPNVIAEKEKVAEAQKRLQELHYGPGKADGDAGPMTEKAVASFQKENKLPVTGDLDKATAEKLQDEAAKAFPIGAREGAKPQDLGKTSRTEAETWRGKRDASVKGTLAIVAALLSLTEGITSSIDKIGASTAGLALLAGGGLLGAIALIDYLRFGRIRWFRLEDHKTAQNAGDS